MEYTAFDESKWKGLVLTEELLEKENGTDAWHQFKAAGKHIAPLIESTPTGLEYLTSHGVGHCYRIARRIGNILPDMTDLNGTEILTLLCAILYHDIGMWRHYGDEIAQYLENEDFQIFARLHFEALFEKVNLLLASDEQEERAIGLLELIRLIAQWRRSIHPLRSAEILKKGARNDSVGKNIPENIADGAATIIEAHGWDSYDVLTTSRLNGRRFECFGCQDFVNLRYLSVLLRLGDLLDVGRERVPQIVKQSLGKELLPLESEAHWIKEERVAITKIDSNIVKIEGIFDLKNEVEKKACTIARKWVDYVEKEIEILHELCSDPEIYEQEKKIKNGVGDLKLYAYIVPENFRMKDVRYILAEEINLLKIYYDLDLEKLRNKVEYVEKTYPSRLTDRNIRALEISLESMEAELGFFVYLYRIPTTRLPINGKLSDILLKYVDLCAKISKICSKQNIMTLPSFPYLDQICEIMEGKT